MTLNTDRWLRAVAVSTVSLALTAPAMAAGNTQPRATAGAQASQQQSYHGLRATQLIGHEVRNAKGQNLGEIADLIVDMNTGAVRYSILRFDPGMFSGERLFAVPTSELRMSRDREEVVYDMSRERLEKAGVETRRWPAALRDRTYLAGLDRTYGIVQPSSDRRAFSAAELIGKDINNRDGREIGEIRDLVINMDAGTVHYAVMTFDPGWVEPEKIFAFPLHAFHFTDDKDELVLNVNKATLQAMRSFDHRLWSALNDLAFVTEIDRYLVTVTPAVGGTK